MSQQVSVRQIATSLSATDGGFGLNGNGLDTAGAFEITRTPIPLAGTIDKLTIILPAAVAASASKIFTLAVNGSNTALTGTIAAGQSGIVCTGGPITVAAGDLVHVNYTHTGTPGATTALSISYVFTPAVANGSIYLGVSGIGTATRFIQLFNPGDANSTSSANDVMNVVAAPGNITGYYISMPPSVGSSGSYTWTIFKNGVAQDGTGGTVNTVIGPTNTSVSRVTASTTFTLPVVAGDLVYLQCTLSGASAKTCAFGIAFKSTNSGESNLCWAFPAIPGTAGASSFNGPSNKFSFAFGSEAANLAYCAGKFKLTSMYLWLTAAPAGVTSRSFRNRQNGGNGSFVATITGAATTGNDTAHTDTYNALDSICFDESAVSGSPAAATGSVSFVMKDIGGGNAGKGGGNSNKSGGGALHQIVPGGATYFNLGNPGLDIVTD